jgi:transposase
MLLLARSSLGWKLPPEMRENLYYELEQRGYVLRLFHPGQTHHFHQQRGLRAKTDRLDAMTMGRHIVEWGGTNGLCARRTSGYLSRTGTLAYAVSRDTAASYQNEIQALIVVLFPEFTQVFADPCLPTALSVRNRFPKCSGPGRSWRRTPFPVVTSTASSPRRAPYRKDTARVSRASPHGQAW